MNLLDMKPGREMDCEIGRVVMELECYLSREEWAKAGMPHMQYWSNAVQYPAYWHEDHEQALCIPDYSTTWEGMGMVVEELKTKVQWIGLETFGEKVRCCIIVKKSNDRKDDKWHEAVSEFAPHAVCLAALLAKEGEHD